jgi:hypothetical protein
MDAQPAFGFKQLFTHIVGDMARAISERVGETSQQQFTRTQAAVQMIMGFMPRDVMEAMVAGHCVMFHELMTDSFRNTMRGEMDSHRRATRNNIIAQDKCFGVNLARLERYQARPSQGRRDAPDALPAEATIEAEITDLAPRPPMPEPARKQARPVQTPTAAAPETPAADQPTAEATAIFHPSPEAIAACMANPEAMAALDAGDPDAFARALGIDQPSEAYLTAAARAGVFEQRVSGVRRPDPEAHRPDGANEGGVVRMVREGSGKSSPG